jgi:uncharacterized membrane protein YdbT with pleckstrin-like domain
MTEVIIMKQDFKWNERKRIWCGLPWTFTKYGMNDDRIFVRKGFLNIKETEVRLYRILNISISRSFIQRIFGLGTIHIDSTDHDLKCFELKNIKHSEEIKEMISESVEEERSRNRVSSREFMSGSGEGDDMEDLDDDI